MKLQNIDPLLAKQQGTASIKLLRVVSLLFLIFSVIGSLLTILTVMTQFSLISFASLIATIVTILMGLLIGAAGLCFAMLAENVLATRVIAQAERDSRDGC